MTIKFEKLGLNDEKLNDIKNFRIMSEKFKYLNGEKAQLEICFNHRLFKEKDKKCIYAMLFIYDDRGICNGNYNFEVYVNNAEFEYNKENVLKVVNMVSREKFTEIEFI